MRKALLLLLLGLSFIAYSNDTLNPCLMGRGFHIVVLGSSTAAGSGPQSSDSTWVNRYRRFLKSISSNNQVTNLAQGGTTTYQIMPDWFTPPAGRPATNTARNVSQAIRLGADAIIVNMPSNDAALGFSLQEQMANFITIFNSADSAGIPVWVCTTQPRNFSAAKVQLQMDARDSIFSYFGSKAIDFWNGFADSTGYIKSGFDSGDGVHMNDAAHKILFERVAAKNILSAIVDTLGFQDHFVFDLQSSAMRCGSPLDSLYIHISNRGVASTGPMAVEWTIEDLKANSTTVVFDTLAVGISTCSLSRSVMPFNTAGGGLWAIHVHLLTPNDSITVNDFSDTLIISTRGLPAINAATDTVCKGNVARLWAQGGDTLVWYDDQRNLVGFGDTLQVAIHQSEMFTASAVYGPLVFQNSLAASPTSNVNWNGIMYDLIAIDTVTIDSLSLKIQLAGKTEVKAYTRSGSYRGFENQPTAWTLWGVDSVDAGVNGGFAVARFGSYTLNAGDTLGVYLSMPAGQSLQYQNAGGVKTYTDGVLTLVTGSGIANNFGQTYFPRAWAGEVFYNYGYNPRGQCHRDTNLLAVVSQPNIDLGPDTVLANFFGTLNWNLNPAYNHVRWHNGDTTHTFSLDGAQVAGQMIYSIFVTARDRFGCEVSDTVIVTINNTVGLEDFSPEKLLHIFPNPASDRFMVESDYPGELLLEICDGTGTVLRQWSLKPGKQELHFNLPAGVYFLRVPANGRATMRLIVQ